MRLDCGTETAAHRSTRVAISPEFTSPRSFVERKGFADDNGGVEIALRSCDVAIERDGREPVSDADAASSDETRDSTVP